MTYKKGDEFTFVGKECYLNQSHELRHDFIYKALSDSRFNVWTDNLERVQYFGNNWTLVSNTKPYPERLEVETKSPHKCNCDNMKLMWSGCCCGGI
jgi:hypothetical protein